MKAGSKNWHLGLIKTLINPPSFHLGLMISATRACLSVTPPNDFRAYSFDKSFSCVQSDMFETFLSNTGQILMEWQKILVIVIYGQTSLYSIVQYCNMF